MHKSIATIDSPEFINLQPLDINPLMSKCDIKVFYLGDSRNRTVIDKATGNEMAKTLRGAPIVGYYKEKDEDFADHGEQVIIDDEGVKFNCLTVPYGFVAPDAKVWWQKFDDYDELGNATTREYMMTTGYLWTGQFPECQIVVDEGRPHSMELDKDSLQGNWSNNYKNGMDFFIINDAVFSKLCILGDTTEPCFEGSSVTAPEVSSSFALDDNFKNTLFTMMQDLKNALQGGDKIMELEKDTVIVEEELVTDFSKKEEEKQDKETKTSEEEKDKDKKKDFVAKKDEEKDSEEDKKDEKEEDDDKKKKSSFKKDEDEKKEDKKESSDDSESEEKSDEKEESDSKEDKEDDDKKKKPATKSALEVENEQLKVDYADLLVKYTSLENEVTELKSFKLSVENKEKDELIASFTMLSDEDKADVIANKEKFSLADIKKELAVICFDKKISFTKVEEVEEKHEDAVTFNLNVDSSLPEWVKDVKEIQEH